MRFFVVEGTDNEDEEVTELIEAPNLETAYEIANELDIMIDDITETFEERK